MIRAVELHVLHLPEGVGPFSGPNLTYKLGTCWFEYYIDGTSKELLPGRIQFVNHLKGIFFPEAQLAGGFAFNLIPGTIIELKQHYTQSSNTDTFVLGSLVNLAAGKLAGLKPMAASGLVGSAPTLGPAVGSNTFGAPR